MRTLKELNAIENQFIINKGGVLAVTEGDWEQNTISRNKIRAFKNEFDTCFLGKFNYFDGLKEYRSGMVYNFEYNFCISDYDQELVDMLEEYNTPKEHYDSNLVMKQIKKITNRVTKLGGIFLNWV